MRLRASARAGVAVLLGLTALATAAQAAPAYLNQGMNLRAGPGVDYPLLASLPPGTRAEVFGCLQGWSWCDVATSGLRGWIAGVGLQVVYDDQPEPLPGYGAEVGLPFVGFDVGNYWGRYYRGRPFYSQVDRFHGDPGGYGERGPRGDFRRGDFRDGPGGGRPGGEGRGPGQDDRRGDFRGPDRAGPDRPPGDAGGRMQEQGRDPGYGGGRPGGGAPGGRGIEPGRGQQQPGPQRGPEPRGNPGPGGGHGPDTPPPARDQREVPGH